jgi:hypothetical protein
MLRSGFGLRGDLATALRRRLGRLLSDLQHCSISVEDVHDNNLTKAQRNTAEIFPHGLIEFRPLTDAMSLR